MVLHLLQQRLNTEDVRRRNREIGLEEQRIRDDAQEINRDQAIRAENLQNLARLNVDQLTFEQERVAAELEEAQRQFNVRTEVERERLARQQGLADPVAEEELAGLRERLGQAERAAQIGQAVEQDVRRRADEDRRQADARDQARLDEIRTLGTQLELERAREPPPAEVEFRVERVQVPASGLTAADRELLARGLQRLEQGQQGIFDRTDIIEEHLMRTGREGDASAAQALQQGENTQYQE